MSCMNNNNMKYLYSAFSEDQSAVISLLLVNHQNHVASLKYAAMKALCLSALRLWHPLFNTTAPHSPWVTECFYWPNMSQFWKQEETGDPEENLRERAWIGRTICTNSRGENWTPDPLVQGEMNDHYTTRSPTWTLALPRFSTTT